MFQVIQNIVSKSHPPLSAPCVGDKVDVHIRIVEGNKERIQVFQGVVLKIGGHGVSKSFTVRKISNGVGVEKTFPLNSPVLSKVKIISKSKVRRARLYYIRKLKGKSSRLTAAFFSKKEGIEKEANHTVESTHLSSGPSENQDSQSSKE